MGWGDAGYAEIGLVSRNSGGRGAEIGFVLNIWVLGRGDWVCFALQGHGMPCPYEQIGFVSRNWVCGWGGEMAGVLRLGSFCTLAGRELGSFRIFWWLALWDWVRFA